MFTPLQLLRMSNLRLSLSIPISPRHLSAGRVLYCPNQLFLPSKLQFLSIRHRPGPRLPPIRMGGGPRTFPGGVSKWQWKRMQEKKAKQLLKARLARERQIYEMRKRAELKAAISDLERPWEVVKKAPRLLSVKADEQVKVLADRFQKPGGFDMWSERDGPQVFSPVDGVPTARFFPKGVVHSIRPYGKIKKNSDGIDKLPLPGLVSESENGKGKNGYRKSGNFRDGSSSESHVEANNSVELPGDRNGKGSDGKFRKKGRTRRSGVENSNYSNGMASGGVGDDGEQRKESPARRNGNNGSSRSTRSRKQRAPNTEVFDMSRQHDGSYRFQGESWKRDSNMEAKKSAKYDPF